MHFTADLTHLPLETRRRVVEKLGDQNAAQLALAKVRQAKIAKMYNDAVAPGTTVDGIGPVSLAIDPYFVSYFRIQYGNGIFNDPDFEKYLKKRGEEFRIRETGTRIQSGYTGPIKTRFKKHYV